MVLSDNLYQIDRLYKMAENRLAINKTGTIFKPTR